MDTMEDVKLRTEVRAALEAVVACAPGIEARFDMSMPWLQEPGANDGYWVAIGLEHYSDMPAPLWRTFLFVSYVSDDDDAKPREHLLDVKLSGAGARDGAVLAAMALAAVQDDLAKRRDQQ